MKVCTKCGIEKPKNAFYRQVKVRDGLQSQCKECTKAASKTYYDAHREEMKEIAIRYREKYPEKCKKRMEAWRKNNRERVNQAREKYLSKAANREIVKRAAAKRSKLRRETDPNYKLVCSIRDKVRKAIMRDSKSCRSIELLGCSAAELKQHIESQFKTGMSWDNWSQDGWHIDHITPISFFDLSKSIQQRKCFNYTNLQPLWAKENLSKGGINRTNMTKAQIFDSMVFYRENTRQTSLEMS